MPAWSERSIILAEGPDRHGAGHPLGSWPCQGGMGVSYQGPCFPVTWIGPKLATTCSEGRVGRIVTKASVRVELLLWPRNNGDRQSLEGCKLGRAKCWFKRGELIYGTDSSVVGSKGKDQARSPQGQG